MQLTPILPPPSGHRKCYMRITVTMPGAEAHIVRSQDGIYVMINFSLYYPGQFRRSSLPRLNFTKPKLNRISCRSTNESQFQFDCNSESRLHCYRTTMAIDNQYDGEVVDGATNFQKREIAVSDKSSPTDKSKAHGEAGYRNTHREVDQEAYREVDHDSTEAAYRVRAPLKSTERSTEKSTKILLKSPIGSDL